MTIRGARARLAAAMVVLGALLMGIPDLAWPEALRGPQPLSLVERLRAEQARRHFRVFVEDAWPEIEPKEPFVANWHVDGICAHLEAVSRGEITQLLINVPPGCMKSLLVSVMWPAWEWATNAELRYLCVSYDQSLSTRDNRRCRDLVTSAWYQARWPHVQLRSDQNQKTRYDTTATGWRIGTSVTGRGLGEHPDRKIVDDPHNAKQSESDAERQRAINFFDGTLSTRGTSRGAATIVIMQRLHQQDLSGHILAKEDAADWVHLCFPMRYEPARMATTPLGFQDPRTTEGELLWPTLFPERKVRKTETDLGSYRSAGQLQQRPASAEGGILKRHQWRYYEPNRFPTRPEAVVLSVDTNLKAKALADFAVVQAWSRCGADRYLLKQAKDRYEYPELKRQIRAMYDWARQAFPHASLVVIIENKAAGPELIADLQRVVPGVIPENPEDDKVQRAIAATPALEAGNIFLPGFPSPDGRDCDKGRTPLWVQEFITECADFPNARNDDQVDTFSQAQRRLSRVMVGVSDEDVLDANEQMASEDGRRDEDADADDERF